MNFKEFIEKLLKEKRSKMDELQKKSDASQDINEVRSIGDQMRELKKEIEDAEVQLRALDDGNEPEEPKVPEDVELRNATVVGSYGRNAGDTEKDENDMEYRKAFMEFVQRGTPIPAELRADESTTTGDIGSVIPTVLVNQIIEKFDNVGMILPLVTKTSYAAGVEIPTSTVKPVATWVGTTGNLHGENATSDTKKKTTGKITFSYYKLRCEISLSMESSTMALSAFEAKFTENVAKAMTYAIENAIINGTGTSQPKGILAETPTQAFTPTAITFAGLVEAEGALPVEYETGAKWCMNKKTFAKVQGMVDSNGQPIARVNFGVSGSLERSILGRDVVVSPYVPDDTLFMFDFSDYVLNTIYDMGISRKQDWDTEAYLTKAVMSVDGKCVDTGSLVKVTVTPKA